MNQSNLVNSTSALARIVGVNSQAAMMFNDSTAGNEILAALSEKPQIISANNIYSGYRYPKEIISHVVWLYHRFTLRFRDKEELLAYRIINVTYESNLQWCQKFGQTDAKRLRNKYGKKSNCWFLDEVFLTIKGKRHYLWRAVDQYVSSRFIFYQTF